MNVLKDWKKRGGGSIRVSINSARKFSSKYELYEFAFVHSCSSENRKFNTNSRLRMPTFYRNLRKFRDTCGFEKFLLRLLNRIKYTENNFPTPLFTKHVFVLLEILWRAFVSCQNSFITRYVYRYMFEWKWWAMKKFNYIDSETFWISYESPGTRVV